MSENASTLANLPTTPDDELEMSDEVRGRLLLEQRSDEEINQAVLKPMFQTGKGFSGC